MPGQIQGQVILPGNMTASSLWTWPQLRRGRVHFFVSSKVARYKALSRALPLGKTLLARFRRR